MISMSLCFDRAIDLHTMSKRAPKDLENDDFAAALKDWESDHPDAWEQAAARAAPPATKPPTEGGLADQLRDKLDKVKAAEASGAGAKTVSQRDAVTDERTAGPRTKAKRRVTEEELMREAFEALDVDSYDPTSKFRG